MQKDDEIALDFSKITDFFKKKRKIQEHKNASKKDDEFFFDIRGVKKFLTKNKTLFLILIPIFLAIFFRMYSFYLPITDDWTESSLHNAIRNQIADAINRENPNLPDIKKQALIEENFNQFLKENKEQIDSEIKRNSEYFKNVFRDDDGNRYLLAIDPYYWLRHARNVVDHGYAGDEIRDGKQYDTYMIAPKGRKLPFDMLHAYVTGYSYKFFHFFNRDLDLMSFMFFMPVILIALSVIPIYFITKMVAGDFGALIASIVFAINPTLLTRTVGGFSDTDSYSVLLPLFIMWFFLTAFESKNLKKILVFTILSGFLVGLFAFAWGGWWYIFDFLLIALGVYLIYYAFTHKTILKKSLKSFLIQPAIKNTLIIFLIFILTSAFFVTLFVHFDIFIQSFGAPFDFIHRKEVATSKIWPNVHTTVAEQNVMSLRSTINNLGGGNFLFLFSIIGILLTLARKDIHGKVDIKYATILILWFIATLYSTTKGIRFAILVVPVFAIGIGLATGIIINFIFKKISFDFLNKYLRVKEYIPKTILVLIIIFLLANTILNLGNAAQNIAKQETPSVNDAWYNSLKQIDEKADKDAIITSWWDFGHWFKAIGNRKVTFDGTSQDKPMAHWVGKLLLTNNERLAVGILRMLDCGSNDAFDELDKVINKGYKSIDILNEILVLDKENAKKALLNNGLTNEQAELVLKNTHCDPPEAYLITSDDMVYKSGVWSHFGSWDFKRATILNKVRKKNKTEAINYLTSEFKYNEEEANKIYSEVISVGISRDADSWIAPWPSYTNQKAGCNKVNSTIFCGSLKLDFDKQEAFFLTEQGVTNVKSVVFPYNNDVKKLSYNDGIGISAIVYQAGDNYEAMLSDPKLADSMFSRLFFMKGLGLKHFTLFTEAKQVSGGDIYIWKVNW